MWITPHQTSHSIQNIQSTSHTMGHMILTNLVIHHHWMIQISTLAKAYSIIIYQFTIIYARNSIHALISIFTSSWTCVPSQVSISLWIIHYSQCSFDIMSIIFLCTPGNNYGHSSGHSSNVIVINHFAMGAMTDCNT